MPISVDLTQLSGYSSLAAGTTYSITAVAKGTGNYTSSNKSAASSYTTPKSPPSKGDLINIDMTGSGTPQQYRVLKVNGNVAEVVAMSKAANIKFDSSGSRTYAEKTLDTYLNTTWYNSLSVTAKAAIVDKTFRQDSWYSWSNAGNPDYQAKESNGLAYQVSLDKVLYGKEITRHVYALSVQDIIDYLEVTPQMTQSNTTLTHNNVWTMFWNSTTAQNEVFWLRSASASSNTAGFTVGGGYGHLSGAGAQYAYAARPALTIDLSKIEWN